MMRDMPPLPAPFALRRTTRRVTRLDLGDDWPRAVCHDNAARLFGLL